MGSLYQVQDSAALLKGHKRLLARHGRARRVSRTVVLLGIVSMLTDISSEMVAAVLPAYLVYTLGFSPLQYGIVDGVYQGASALVRLASGFVGDRFRRHKEVATAGYGLSALCKLLLATVGAAWGAVGAVVLLDRTGKGIRTAPRDAMISLNSEPDSLATSFGVHRALDTTGALLGPLVAFGLLAIAPLAFDSLFLVSFCIAVVGVAVLVLFVDGRPGAGQAEEPAPPPSLREAGGILGLPGLRALMVIGAGLSLVTMSDAFIYLALEQRVDFEPTVFPLLFVCTAAAYMLLAVPAGQIADRVGRTKVFVAGYCLLLLVYCVLLLPATGWWAIPVALLLLGSYYAATDGVLMAIGGALSPPHLRGTALAVLGTATSLGRLFASIAFGALWVTLGLEGAIACFGGALLATLVCAGAWLWGGRRELGRA